KPFKKVIAQQVETVYPQVVSRHVDFIPNVYQPASAVRKVARGYLLRFDGGHHLSPAAKRIKFLVASEHTFRQAEIVAIPSEREAIVDVAKLDGDQVFVYGEQVDDFRTVDYEGLTALNISATQELAKRVAQQQAEIAALRHELAATQEQAADIAA